MPPPRCGRETCPAFLGRPPANLRFGDGSRQGGPRKKRGDVLRILHQAEVTPALGRDEEQEVRQGGPGAESARERIVCARPLLPGAVAGGFFARGKPADLPRESLDLLRGFRPGSRVLRRAGFVEVSPWRFGPSGPVDRIAAGRPCPEPSTTWGAAREHGGGRRGAARRTWGVHRVRRPDVSGPSRRRAGRNR